MSAINTPPLTLSILLGVCVVLGSCESNESAGAASTTEASPAVVEALAPAECGSIQRIHAKGGIYLSSQPQIADLEQAKAMGIKTIIDQRLAGENTDFDEGQVVRDMDLTYLNPGWNGVEQFTDQILNETREMLRSEERPLLIHCASANRTGATWMAYRVLDEGASLEDAVAEAKTVGMRSPDYERIARDYIDRTRGN